MIKPPIIVAAALLFASAIHSFAVVGQSLDIHETNLVLSWPSQGYEQYLIQYRQTLDPTDSWSTVTNDYPANSTNRSTYIIYGVVPLPSTNGSSGNIVTNPPPAPDSASGTMADSAAPSTTESSEPMVMLANGSGTPVPLAIYPPGFDLSGFIIFDPATGQWVSGNGYSINSSTDTSTTGATPMDESSGGAVSTGFYRVFHIPNWSADVTNYVFDGPTFVPVDFADYRERVENLQVLIDGEPMPYADYTSSFYNGQTNWGMGIYFDRLANGTHQIQLVSTLHINDDINENAVYLVLSNLTQTITVSNEVTFPNWNDFIQGDTYTFNAQTANPDTDWEIDIYDANDNYVNSGYGHTSDGSISWTWDLTDYSGSSRDDFEGDPYFYSQITFDAGSTGGASPQIQATKPMPLAVSGYPDRGQWLIAFQDRWFADAPGYPSDCQGKYDTAMQDIWGGPNLIGDTAQWYPIRFGTNVYSQADRDYSWTNLLAWIGDLHVRNFYCHGHGGATSLGADRHTLDTNGLVTGSALASKYSKAQIFSWQVALKTRYDRYRFVFLDDCNTADGDWPNAFTTSKTNHDLSFYQNDPKHRRPSVFVGWTGISGGEGSVYDWLNWEDNWMGIWANGSGYPSIKDSLEQANDLYHWLSAGEFDSKIRIYGYQSMTIRDYNRKGDWRWP